MPKTNDIGALWLNESQAGKKYLSGSVEVNGEKIKVVVFKNSYKKNDNQPDYRIYESKPQGQEEQDNNQTNTGTEEDDIPF